VVGVSGGKDSLCLLSVLSEMNRRLRREWVVLPVHIDPGFAGWRAERVIRACRKLGLECSVRRLDLPPTTDRCYSCARARRKALFQTAAELGAKKVALGHHLEDVNETYLMNLLMTASGAAFLPRQDLFSGRIALIRPLYYASRPQIERYLRSAGIRPARSRCPFEHKGTRLVVRRFLERLYHQDLRIRTNLFWGIHNPKPEYSPRKKS